MGAYITVEILPLVCQALVRGCWWLGSWNTSNGWWQGCWARGHSAEPPPCVSPEPFCPTLNHGGAGRSVHAAAQLPQRLYHRGKIKMYHYSARQKIIIINKITNWSYTGAHGVEAPTKPGGWSAAPPPLRDPLPSLRDPAVLSLPTPGLWSWALPTQAALWFCAPLPSALSVRYGLVLAQRCPGSRAHATLCAALHYRAVLHTLIFKG